MAALPLIAAGGTLVAGGISAASTLAGGDYAAEAGSMQRAAANRQAEQMEMNATQSIASGQRKMFDTQQKARMLISSSVARAGASGVDASSGSPAENAGEIAGRGSYHALMDMFNGESEATGLRNQAAGVRYSGELAEWEGSVKQSQSRLAALGTLAGSIGSAASTYGGLRYPTARGSAGVNL